VLFRSKVKSVWHFIAYRAEKGEKVPVPFCATGVWSGCASAKVLSVLVPRSASALHKCGARTPVPNAKIESQWKKVSGTLLYRAGKAGKVPVPFCAFCAAGLWSGCASAKVLSVLVPRSASALHKCGARTPVPNEKSEVKGKKCLALYCVSSCQTHDPRRPLPRRTNLPLTTQGTRHTQCDHFTKAVRVCAGAGAGVLSRPSFFVPFSRLFSCRFFSYFA
jgi:uncharacterized membrane protein